MPITDWPQDERPREKLMARGPESLSDAELLAIFLRTGIRGMTAVDLGRDLIQRFGSLGRMLSATPAEFCESPGMGPAKYAELQASLELGRRYLAETASRDGVLRSPGDTRNYIAMKLQHRPQEVFLGLFLDSQHRIIACEELFYGTIDSASVHPREVVRRAMAHNAAAMIFAHNHPSGIAEPSSADRNITDRLAKALELVDIRTLDHIVVGHGQTTSFAERGWL